MTTQAAAAAVYPATQRQFDEAVARLREAAPAFARLPIPDRIALARSMQSGFVRVGDQLVRAACAAKGLPTGTPVESQEWSTGPWPVIRQLRLTAESLASLQRTGNTPIGPVSRSADDRLTVRVFPANAIDGVLFAGVTVDVRMQAGIS
jgi:acyl-CoA reductase-like NAD-dependent aldehyde dehydrogenase